MSNQSLHDLEAVSNTANQAYYESYQTAKAADEKAAAANDAYQKTLNDLYNTYDGYDTGNIKEKEKAYQEASKAKEEADAELAEATKVFEDAANEAQDAEDAVEARKEELRASRATDMTFVVHTARAECSFGLKESYLALDATHGIYTRQIAQMIVTDQVFNQNVINFCGCRSKENPRVIAEADRVAAEARAEIEAKKTWRDDFVQWFCGETEIKVDDSLIEQVVGECVTTFPKDLVWLDGHDKVTINEKSPLLRRCELKCNYGGSITILLSGQPE